MLAYVVVCGGVKVAKPYSIETYAFANDCERDSQPFNCGVVLSRLVAPAAGYQIVFTNERPAGRSARVDRDKQAHKTSLSDNLR